MTAGCLPAVAVKTQWVSPDALQVGDVVIIAVPLPSEEGYEHRVDDVRDLGRGYVRVWFDVYEPCGTRRSGALEGHEFFRWDRVYDVAPERGDITMVEVVA